MLEQNRSAIRRVLAVLEQEGVGNFDITSDDEFEMDKMLRNKSSSLSSLNNEKPKRRRNRNSHPHSHTTDQSVVGKTSGSKSSSKSKRIDPKIKRSEGDKIESQNLAIIKRRNESSRAVTNQKQLESASTVRFSDRDKVCYIPHLLDIPQEEIDECWMNEEDYSAIRTRSMKLVEMMEENGEKNSRNHVRYPMSADGTTMIVNGRLVCVRGLKGMTSPCSHLRNQQQTQMHTAVFRLQELLKERNSGRIADPDVIGQLCKEHTKNSIKMARMVGISDEVNSTSSSSPPCSPSPCSSSTSDKYLHQI